MLTLFVIFLAIASDMPVIEPVATPTPAAAPSPEPTMPPGVEQQPIEFEVIANASALLRGDPAELERLEAALSQHTAPLEQAGRRAAFVITFGGSSSPIEGVSLAKAGNDVLAAAAGSLMQGTVVRNFWQSLDGNVQRGTLTFELYLFLPHE
jgi:hypothetical protein